MKKSSIRREVSDILDIEIYVRIELRYGKKAVVTPRKKIKKDFIYFFNIMITPKTLEEENRRLGVIQIIAKPDTKLIGEIHLFKEEVSQKLYMVVYKEVDSEVGDKFADNRRIELDDYMDTSQSYKNNMISDNWFNIISEMLFD